MIDSATTTQQGTPPPDSKTFLMQDSCQISAYLHALCSSMARLLLRAEVECRLLVQEARYDGREYCRRFEIAKVPARYTDVAAVNNRIGNELQVRWWTHWILSP